jgi:acyl-CoA reductase-like NAD-dependent aldehyde dehydrogenase
MAMLMIMLSGNAQAEWSKMSKAARTTALNAIADECKLPRKTFSVEANGEWHIRPPRSANYEDVDCGLRKVREVLGLQRMGFVGNESSEPEKK